MTALVRLAGLPAALLDRPDGHAWQVLISTPRAAGVLATVAGEVMSDVEARLAAGQHWSDKRLRQRDAYLWRLLGRAALKTTPRGWLGHVAVVPVSEHDAETLLAGDLTVHGFTAHEVENVWGLRQSRDATLLGLAPLHVVEGDQIRFHGEDGAGKRLRHTAATRAVFGALRGGAAESGAVRAALVPELISSAEVADAFLDRLVSLGVLRRSRPPAVGLTTDATPGTPGNGAFVDVYRTVHAVVPPRAVDRVRGAVTTLSRLARLMRADAPSRPDPAAAALGEHPRSLAELVIDLARQPTPPRPEALRWRPAATAGSGYARLLAHLAPRLGEPVIDLEPVLPAEPDAASWDWPVDCLIRPLPTGRPLGVLEVVTRAGALDARFAEGLALHLGEEPRHVTEYREFLHDVAARAGAEPVEVLMPVAAAPGANSVRRPRYTRRWTGDPDPAAYWPANTAFDLAEHLPLGEVTLRRAGDRVIAEHEGRELWLHHHATRAPSGPWRHLASLLALAAPGRPVPALRLGGLLGAFPRHDRAPRVTAGNDVVVSCAQWRIGPLWRETDPLARKQDAVVRLRELRGLPRWVFARSEKDGGALPVDLDGASAVRLLDRIGRAGWPLLVEEMLPAPDQLVVREAGEGLCAQVQLRIAPCRSTSAIPDAEVG